MLSKFLLKIQDTDARQSYRTHTKAKFSKIMPITTVQMLLIAAAVEVIQRGYPQTTSGAFSNTTSVVNWISALIMMGFSLAVRKFYPFCAMVAPLLTMYCFYYLCVVDLAPHIDQAYNVMVFGLTLTFLILVFYGVSWIANSIAAIALFPILMWRQGQLMLGQRDASGIVGARCAVLLTAYAIISYKFEQVSKMAFLSGQQAEGSFNRWLKTFDSFPEGIALFRGEEIVYSNTALKRQFGLEAHRGKDSIVKVLKVTKIKKYVRSDTSLKQRNKKDKAESRDKHDKIIEISVQDFINSDKKSDLFEIVFNQQLGGPTTEAEKDVLFTNFEQQRSQPRDGKRFIQLVKVAVRVGGRSEKLLIVRDESYKVCLEQMMETKELMQDFTDSMVEQIDNQAEMVSNILGVMQEEFISDAGQSVADDCSFCMKKMRYRIRDYRDVYDIADSTFETPDQQQINLQECLKEVHRAVQSELTRLNIEVSIALHESCPKTFAASNDMFNQIAINLLTQTMFAVGQRGFIKMNSYRKQVSQVNSLVLDFDASKYSSDKAMQQMDLVRLNLANERDIRKIMSANVDLNFKIAKILCNQLGWKLEFRFKNSTRYSLVIPLLSSKGSDQTSDAQKLAGGADYDIEESWDLRPTTSLPRSIKQVKEKYFMKDNYAELDQIDEGTRPYSAQVPNLTQAHQRFKQILVVKEDPQMENAIESPQNSTKTLGMDTVARNKLTQHYQTAKPPDALLLMNFTEVYLYEECQIKIVETFSEKDAVEKVRKSLKSNAQSYRYLLIDKDIQKRVNLKWIEQSIRDVHKAQNMVPKLKIVVLQTQVDPQTKEECELLGIKLCGKPATADELRQMFQLETTSNRD